MNYAYNKTGHVSGITLGTAAIASDITYMPFGPLKSLTFDNGAVLARAYNQNYQLTHQTVDKVDDDSYAYDKDGNITTFTNAKTPPLYKNYTYDANDNRLTQVNGVAKQQPIPIRLPKAITLPTYPQAARSKPWLLMQTAISPNFDQLATATTSQGSASYTYNGLGQQVIKTVCGKNTIFVYGQFGKLLEIVSPTTTTDFVYLYGQPIAMVQGDAVYYYYITNAQGTPFDGQKCQPAMGSEYPSL